MVGPQARAAVYRQKLFDNRHVCLVRLEHPAGQGGTLSMDEYLAVRHGVIRPEGREHVFEQNLQGQGLHRHVAIELSHF